jgi:hypothetical protein
MGRSAGLNAHTESPIRDLRRLKVKRLKKTWETVMQIEKERHDKETNVLMSQIRDLQEQLQVVMVSVPCMHVAVQCDQVA